jgi:nucleoside-triphosphatase
MSERLRAAADARRILLTGRPGCGKTTVIRRTVELIGTEACVGFYTEEVRREGRRVGFDVVTLDGRRGPLARAGASGPRVGRYGVDVESFERLGVGCLEAGLGTSGRVLVVDEIGKMELFSERFVDLLENLFAGGGGPLILGSILSGRNAVADRVRQGAGVELIQVTAANRDDLPTRLAQRIRALLLTEGSTDSEGTL